ncbi:MAG: L-histidine N(alpha)-methyltransferase [Casimicrobiaceae bacterium]
MTRHLVPIRHRLRVDAGAVHAALVAGLRAPNASISPKYFYDAAGCELFAAICELPEYYPTRTERGIFDAHRGEIAHVIGSGTQLVDLGAGDCRKAAQWFAALRPVRYIAVDIAAQAITQALASLSDAHPGIGMTGIVADFTQTLDLESDLDSRAATFFYPGSSIGNFRHPAARAFIAGIARHCATRPGSGLLIGVDMQKDVQRLVAAYDDAQGVTAAFNRNVLLHANRIAPANFDADAFDHRASWDAIEGRVQMHLEARRTQTVDIAGAQRSFRAGERIHTEDSYKYTPAQFSEMLRAAGFAQVSLWQDPAGDFGVFYAR